jgi:N-methylhydantoinase A
MDAGAVLGSHQASGQNRARAAAGGARLHRRVPERADYKGAITQELDEAAAEAAIRFLIDSKDIEAIAVSFLWSFYNADDERKVKKLLEHIAHGIYCTLSSDIAPLPGEYERSSPQPSTLMPAGSPIFI